MSPSNLTYMSDAVFEPMCMDPGMVQKAEAGRLIHAAIINRTFREKLLTNPVQSIDNGYCGEVFHFSREMKDQIRSIHAMSLEEFSTQIMQLLSAPVVYEVAAV